MISSSEMVVSIQIIASQSFFPAFISDTDNLYWNCLVTNGYINGEQIPRASSAFFALSVDFFDVVSAILITVLDFAAFLNHCEVSNPQSVFKAVMVLGDENQLSNSIYFADISDN